MSSAVWALLLFGARRGALPERSLLVLALEGPGTASPGSSWAASWTLCTRARLDGGWLGPSRRAEDEGPGSSPSVFASLVLLDGCRLSSTVPVDGVAAPWTAAGLPSCPVGAWEASRPSRRCTSALHNRTAWTTSCLAKLAAWLCRELSSHTVSALSSRPYNDKPKRASWNAEKAALSSAPKSCLTSWCTQGIRGRSTAGCWRKMDTQVGIASGWLWGALLALGPSCLTTISSKLSSARTECRMDVTLPLQSGHLGLVWAQCQMQPKQNWCMHGIT